ncbi:MAG TPA: hypothetical protein VFG31_03105 [Conexibacter sp.]|nr:hypothetical protein [Conexibacter sp.]
MDAATAAVLEPGPATTVLAHGPAGPLWLHEGRIERVAVVPGELESDEPLRERLRDGRWLGVLTLLRFARKVAASDWAPPPLAASIVLDDPNLHWSTYGFVDYEELSVHARRYGYHVAMATVPLDGWFVHARAARIFREQPQELSLLVHGNDHVRHELGRAVTPDAATGLAQEALRRVERVERRARLDVARIMVPPHSVCAEPVPAALRRAGFEALCNGRPYAWRKRPPANVPLAGAEPVDVVDGLPILPRVHLAAPRGELALRAWLGQPLIVYGHHEDLADGLGVLAQLAEDIRALGEVRWHQPREIARSRASTRRDGDLLHVRMYARRLDVQVPDAVTRVGIELAPAYGDAAPAHLLRDGRRVEPGAPFPVQPGDRFTLTLDDGECSSSRAPRRSVVWPITRRTLVEVRDRSRPLVARRSASR